MPKYPLSLSFFLLLTIFCQMLKAQALSYARSDSALEFLVDVEKMRNGNLLLVYTNSGTSINVFAHKVVVITPSGKVLWQKTLLRNSNNTLFKAHELANGNILMVGTKNLCDEYAEPYVEILDPSGKLISTKENIQSDSIARFLLKRKFSCVTYTNGEPVYWSGIGNAFTTEGIISRYHVNNNHLSISPFPFARGLNVHPMDSTLLITSFDDHISLLRDGLVIKKIALPKDFLFLRDIFCTPQEPIMIAANYSGILIFDSNKIYQQIEVSIQVSDAFAQDDKIVLLGVSGTLDEKLIYLERIGGIWTVVNEIVISIDKDHIMTHKVIPFEDYFVVFGNEVHGTSGFSGIFTDDLKSLNVWAKAYDWNGNCLSRTADTGILNIDFNTKPVGFVTDIARKFYKVPIEKINVTIQNRGDDTLRSVCLVAYHKAARVLCEPVNHHFFWRFENLKIPPLKQQLLTVGPITLLNFEEGDILPFWTTSPNDLPEADFSNDSISISKFFNPLPTPDQFNVFPNPAHNELHFTVPATRLYGVRAKIYAMTGQLVFEEIVKNLTDDVYSIDISTLPKGMYILDIAPDRMKFVKD